MLLDHLETIKMADLLDYIDVLKNTLNKISDRKELKYRIMKNNLKDLIDLHENVLLIQKGSIE